MLPIKPGSSAEVVLVDNLTYDRLATVLRSEVQTGNYIHDDVEIKHCYAMVNAKLDSLV